MKRRRRRGSALVLSLFFLVLLGLLATALAQLLPVELNSATRAQKDLSAFYAAGGGVEAVLARLKNDWIANVAVPDTFTLTGRLGDWNFSAVATKLVGSGTLTYKVVSTATPVGSVKASRRVVAFIQEKSITDFNIFGQGEVAWNLRYRVEGPVYGGEKLQFWVEGDRWNQNFASFNSIVTTSGAKSSTNIDWKGPGGAANTDAKWQNVTTSGESGVIYNFAQMEIRDPDFIAKALPSGATLPNAAGLYVPTSGVATNGGIAIQGDVKNLKMSVESGNQVLNFRLPNGAKGPALTGGTAASGQDWKVIFAENPITVAGVSVPANSTVIIKPGVATPTVYSGLTNGLVAVNGRLGDGNPAQKTGGLFGVVKGDRTITTTGELDIIGPLMRQDVLNLTDASNPDVRYHNPTAADPPLKIPAPANPNVMDNLLLFGKTKLVLDLAAEDPVSGQSQFPVVSGQQIANLYGLMITQGEFKILGENGNSTGAINFSGAVAQTGDYHHDQFVDANAGGGNNNWTVDFGYEPVIAYKPNAFMPGLGQFSVKAYSEEPLP